MLRTVAIAPMLFIGCAPAAKPPAPATVPPTATPTASAPTPAPAPLTWIEDDIPKARAQALREGKLVLVDAWAPWCHTCLGTKHHVLDEPALRPYAAHVVFAAVDTDRETNAAFLQQHEVRVWPSLFVLDPATDRVLAYWPATASLREVTALLDDAMHVQDANRSTDDPRHALAAAREPLARGQHDLALERFQDLLSRVPKDWSRRSEALVGAMTSLYRKRDWSSCAAFGMTHVGEVTGSAAPADFCYLLTACARHLPRGAIRMSALAAATGRLERIVACRRPNRAWTTEPMR